MNLNIAVLPGDGIGPEIVAEAMVVAMSVCNRFGHEMNFDYGLVGACAIEALGEPYPDTTHQLCMKADAVLFGAIGHPRFDNDPSAQIRPEQGLLAMRKKLGLYANIRPVTAFESLVSKSPLRPELIQGVDIMCIRELTGGIYFGRPQGLSEDGNTATDTCTYTREEIERILHLAYKYALQRRKQVTIVDKANVLCTSRLWRSIGQEIAPQYPDVKTDYMFVDNAAMQLVTWPGKFDVLVTENMFGDILTDEASVITGSLGLLPSASIGVHTSVFEPIHGSYPQATGKNIANPVATILSAALMFEYAFGLMEEGAAIRRAVEASMKAGIVTEDIAQSGKAFKTSEVGAWIANYIRDEK